jgi:hypothetical protein
MRRIRPARARCLAAALLLLPAACEGGGGPAPVAHPDDLEIRIVEGAGQRAIVRPPGEQPPDSLIVRTPVVVRVSLSQDVEDDDGVTGPVRRARLPAVTLHWRTTEPFCQPLHATTQLAPGSDTAVNHYVRPIRAGICLLVVEATVEGRPFGAPDTAAIHFAAGPVTQVVTYGPVLMEAGTLGLRTYFFEPTLFDAYGNAWIDVEYTYEIEAGAPNFAIRDVREGFVWAPAEGYGSVAATSAPGGRVITEAWAITVLPKKWWRLSWECYAMRRGDGVLVDSVHYRMERASAGYGAPLTALGLTTGFQGTLTRREWVHGQPVRETHDPDGTVSGAQRPGALYWPSGQVSPAVPGGYRGGTLCEPDSGGAAWGRTSPLRVEAL